MEDFQNVLYEAVLVAFGKILAKYNVFAQSYILKDVGKEIIEYLNEQVRKDDGYWQQVDAYITEHSEALFSHGICPDCMKALYPDFLPQE